ncbi:MAG: ATP-binding protein, partial [Cyanobacteria bacterium P01_H01_bin.15]
MKRQPEPVPKLDLAPKLKRPLQPWNPLDYLRLLYWVLYFPQALRWYQETVIKEPYSERNSPWGERLAKIGNNPQEWQFLLMGLVLTISVAPCICFLLQEIGVPISWGGVAVGVAVGVAGGVAYGVAVGVAGGVAFGVAFGVAVGVAGGVAVGVAY